MPTWIRVRDDITGAEYDVEASAVRGGCTPVEGYPVLSGEGARPRPDKPFVGKDGQPAMPGLRAKPEPEAEPTEPEPEPESETAAPAQPADIEE